MVYTAVEVPKPSIWLLDSNNSSHMIGRKELFHSLDESDNKEMEVIGRGFVALSIQDGDTMLIHNVQYVPNLAHNI